MGRRGPAPTPTAILKLRGSWRGDARTDEPEAPTDRPTCPRWLRPEAKRVWKRLIPQLETMGVLGTCDRAALARYCQFLARWREAEEYLAAHGSICTGVDAQGNDVIKAHPFVSIANSMHANLLSIEKQFGLTPSARANLAKPKDNPEENRGKGRFFHSATG